MWQNCGISDFVRTIDLLADFRRKLPKSAFFEFGYTFRLYIMCIKEAKRIALIHNDGRNWRELPISNYFHRCWLGRQDSNLRMAIPKTAALPLGHAPLVENQQA